MALHLYDTLRRGVVPFVPRDPSHITFYTCGPTVYDDAHIGNFRSFLAADLLRRWIESPLCTIEASAGEHKGPRRVRHVMNITDVGHMTEDDVADGGGEDKMALAGRRLLEAKKAGTLPPGVEVDPNDPYAIADFYTRRFLEDARRVGLRVAIEAASDASLMPRATEHVEDAGDRLGMIGVIARLLERGHAYVVGEPGSRVVYFDVRSFPAYGRLSGNTLENLREGQGGRVSAENQAGKRHPADFLLWKEDPTHIMRWESPWGQGYPGWHIECTAMSVAHLVEHLDGSGDLIDIHSGGEDNIFPHHECEIAQSCCCFSDRPAAGCSFARLWFHPRFLLVDGEKMSKSRGTFHTVRGLVEQGFEPAAIRLELIRTHYRSNANFTLQGLKDARRMIDRWRRVADAGTDTLDDDALRAHTVARDFARFMDDDLNIAGALGVLNGWVASLETPSPEDAGLIRALDRVLGVLELERPQGLDTGIAIFRPPVQPSDEVVALLEERRKARQARDFVRADAIRDRLRDMGLAIKDVPGGRVEVSRAT